MQSSPINVLASSATTPNSIQWPSIEFILGPGRLKSRFEHWKYYLRLRWSKPYIDGFLNQINASIVWQALYKNRPQHFHPPLSGFLDRRFTVKDRFTHLSADLDLAHHHFGASLAHDLAIGRSRIIATPLPELVVSFGPNEVNPQEGSWAISLRDLDGRRLNNLSFGFLCSGELLIASIQGSPGIANDGLERVRVLTKAAHGLRPPNLLLEALKSAARCWGVSALIGIDPRHHIKGRWNQRKKRLRFDYVVFWTEAGATLDARDYWSIPVKSQRKGFSEIQSNKRSLYRRRFQMLELMEGQIQEALREATGADVSEARLRIPDPPSRKLERNMEQN